MLPESDTSTRPTATACRRSYCCCAFTASPPIANSSRINTADTIGTTEMLRCAKELKLKARVIESDWERLAKPRFRPSPSAATAAFSFVGKVADDSVLIHDPAVGRPQVAEPRGVRGPMERAAHPDDAPGRAWLNWPAASTSPGFCRPCTNTAGCSARCWSPRFSSSFLRSSRRCSFRWSSTRCWCIAGLTTLDVLVIGLVAVSVFESVLTALRTYVFSHTTNRIDVELGARLFRHLVGAADCVF